MLQFKVLINLGKTVKIQSTGTEREMADLMHWCIMVANNNVWLPKIDLKLRRERDVILVRIESTNVKKFVVA